MNKVMAMCSKPREIKPEQLPSELLHAILSALPDIHLLRIMYPGQTSATSCCFCIMDKVKIGKIEEIDKCWVYYLNIPGGLDGCYQHHLSLGLGHIRRLAEAKNT